MAMTRNDDAANLVRDTRPLRDDELDAVSGGVGGWAMPVQTGGVNLPAFHAIPIRALPPSPC
jgi:hypothetical protein